MLLPSAVLGTCIWLHQESLRHILASLEYALGQSRQTLHRWKEDSMLVKRIAASIFNRIRAIARYWSEIVTFSYPLHF